MPTEPKKGTSTATKVGLFVGLAGLAAGVAAAFASGSGRSGTMHGARPRPCAPAAKRPAPCGR